jgi:hypothetical protein
MSSSGVSNPAGDTVVAAVVPLEAVVEVSEVGAAVAVAVSSVATARVAELIVCVGGVSVRGTVPLSLLP